MTSAHLVPCSHCYETEEGKIDTCCFRLFRVRTGMSPKFATVTGFRLEKPRTGHPCVRNNNHAEAKKTPTPPQRPAHDYLDTQSAPEIICIQTNIDCLTAWSSMILYPHPAPLPLSPKQTKSFAIQVKGGGGQLSS